MCSFGVYVFSRLTLAPPESTKQCASFVITRMFFYHFALMHMLVLFYSHTSAHLQKKSTCFSSWTSPYSHLSQMLELPCHLQDFTLKWCARNLNLLKFLNTCLSKSLYIQVGGDRKWRTSRTTLRTPTPLVIRDT